MKLSHLNLLFQCRYLLPIHDWNSLNETRNQRCSATACGVLTEHVSQMSLEMCIPFAIHSLVDRTVVGNYDILDKQSSDETAVRTEKNTRKNTTNTSSGVPSFSIDLVRLHVVWNVYIKQH